VQVLMAFRRRHARVTLAAVSALSIAMASTVVSSAPAAATAGSDRAQIAQLQQQIAAQGARAESLVARSNAVQSQITVLDQQIAQDSARLAADQRVESAASVDARQAAVDAYMNSGGMGSSSLAVFSDATSATNAFEQNNYLSAANSKLDEQLNTLVRDRARTQGAQRVLRSEHARATATLHELARAQHAAASAIASDEAMLRHVNGNLRSLLVAETERRQAAQRAAERALATTPLAPQPPPPPVAPSPLPPSPPPSPSPGGYANPLRAVTALSSERIDQGVDYSGFGPIYAIGDGVVLSTVNGGWPGGTFIAYRLTNGPANGLVVFAAEDIQPTVQVGQTVTSNTVLGQVYAGPTGIETGWADPSASGDTMARTYGQFSGSNSTAFGYNFSRLLQSLGAPGGVLATNPPTGTLPSGWPQW
jgi:murein DD-endopeptidase MepM/ murein hydrolase activator NlpD